MSYGLAAVGAVNIGLALLHTIKSFTGTECDVAVRPWFAALNLSVGLWLVVICRKETP